LPPSRSRIHHLAMRCSGRSWLCVAAFAALAVLMVALAGPSLGRMAADSLPPSTPLPEDRGVAGLREMLLRLNTTARLIEIVAHPDDEDGGVLTLESRGQGDTVLLLTLNRGEGGQNKIGSNLFDVLGVLRTLELTASDRYYGVEQRFTRVADFGYSKTPEETFAKWQGHDVALGDIVRVIRGFRPDVLVARFSGTDRDGHGHHQASSILTREAFRAAADPDRFPEQGKEGLAPWQAKKLYIGNVCPWGAKTCPDDDYTVKFNTGQFSPALGMSYAQFALEGLKHQLSQGAGAWTLEPGDRFSFYKLVDSVSGFAPGKGHEQDFFEGIDTSLPALATRLGAEISKAPFLQPALDEIQARIQAATRAAERDPASAAEPLLAGLEKTRETLGSVETSSLSDVSKTDLRAELNTKKSQFEKAANLALGIEFHVTVDAPAGADSEDAFMAVPGQSFEISAHLRSLQKLTGVRMELDLPPHWKYTEIKRSSNLLPGALVSATSSAGVKAAGVVPLSLVEPSAAAQEEGVTFRVTVPDDASYTRPYWHRNDPERDTLNIIDEPEYVTLAFPPPPVRAHAVYEFRGKAGVAHAVAMVPYKDPTAGELERALAVAPPFSIMLQPGQQVIPTEGNGAREVTVAVSSNLSGPSEGRLHLEVPAGWRVEPASTRLQFRGAGDKQEVGFQVFHNSIQEGTAQIRAVFQAGGKNYSEGYSVVTRPDLDSFYYYQPAVQHLSMVDVRVPKGLKVGYIMGAGDDIPTVLKQIGINVTLVPAERLGSEDLTQYGTLVLGIRANDTQKEIAENRQKLLDFVSQGGTLIVQYNTGVSDFNKDQLTPYHAELSRARVSVEEAPVKILAPDDPVFHDPNPIRESDFNGWVQERGLYFMDKWDDQFKPLLACHDPGEPEQEGGLLRAQYGKGTYIYTGYAFFRQLPAGVPGAIRLYVNLLTAGRSVPTSLAGTR
jgi:LmbE family N-acetylglucosaminyl deacetylase